MQRILEAYQSATELNLKPLQNQLLSLVASDHPRATIAELFNISERQVNNARMHTALYGRGTPPCCSRPCRQTMLLHCCSSRWGKRQDKSPA